MGLLDKIKDNTEQNKFKPIVIDTTNVVEEIKKVASSQQDEVSRYVL